MQSGTERLRSIPPPALKMDLHTLESSGSKRRPISCLWLILGVMRITVLYH